MPQARHAPRRLGKEAERRLRSYLPALVLEHLARTAAPDTPGTEHRFGAAALFADISGFTSMSEALAATGKGGSEEMTELLNDFFGTVVGIIDAHGGSVMAFGGDAVTAVFPFRGRARRAVARAVRCADAMQRRMDRYREMPTSAGTFALTFKAGLAAGPVLLTTVGDERLRHEPVVAGPAIDGSVAAEHRASAGSVVLHPSIAALADAVQTQPLADGFVVAQPMRDSRPPRSRGGLEEVTPSAVDLTTVRAYLHPSIAGMIATGHAGYLNEHRRVTAVFTAFDGPDPMSTGAGEALQRVLRPAFGAIREAGGHLLQVDTGDKGNTFITVFGAPIAHGDDGRRALTFALRARDEVPGARVGLAAGAMFCGEVGGDARRTYATIGDPMNVAARLMQRASRGEVLAVGMADEPARAAIATTAVGPVRIKGRTEPVVPVRVNGPADGRDAMPVVPEIVGRRHERARIRRRLGMAASGRSCTILVTGPAGIGKSRLLEDTRAAASGRGFIVHGGAFPSTSVETPYAGVRTLVGSLLGIPEGSAIGPRRLRTALDAIDAGFAQRAPLVAPVFGITIPDTAATRGLESELRNELLDATVIEVVRHRAATAPLGLFVEDVHRIDRASARLIGSLVRDLRTERVLLLLTARATAGGAVADIATFPNVETIQLAPMDERDVRRLARIAVRRAFGPVRTSTAVIDLLAERSDGIPLFLEETVHLLRDRATSLEDAETAMRDLPVSVHQLVVARLDALPPSHRTLVLQASVLGDDSDVAWLWGSFEDAGSPTEVQRKVTDLRRMDLLEPAPRHRRRKIRFRHASIREAAYETLSLAHRRELHRRVARFVERTYRDDLDAHADVLAYHYGETRETDPQRRYFAAAARKARAAFQHETALTWLRRLEPVVDASERAAVLLETGEVEQLSGSWAAAEVSFSRALRSAEESGDELAVARARAALGHLRTYRGSAEDARALLSSALEPLSRAGDMEWLGRTLEYLAFVTAQASDLEASLDYSRRQLEIAERTGDRIGATMAFEQTGMVLWHRGEYDEAARGLDRALREAEAARYVRGVVLTANDLAGLWVERARPQRAFRYVRRALEAAKLMGYRHAIGVLVGNAGELYRMHGEPERGLRYAVAGLAVTGDLKDWPDVTAKLINIGRCLLDAGRAREAARATELAAGFAAATRDPYLRCEAVLVMGHVESRSGSAARAGKLARQARDVAAEIGRRDVHVAATILALEHAHARGDEAARALHDLRRPDAPDAERVALDVAMWKLAGDETARRRAVRSLRGLVRHAPSVDHRRMLFEVGGIDVPEPERLPPLEEEDPPEPKLSGVFRQARELLAELQ